MSKVRDNWKKIVTVQLAIIGLVLVAQFATVKLANGINTFANNFNTNYTVSLTK